MSTVELAHGVTVAPEELLRLVWTSLPPKARHRVLTDAVRAVVREEVAAVIGGVVAERVRGMTEQAIAEKLRDGWRRGSSHERLDHVLSAAVIDAVREYAKRLRFDVVVHSPEVER